MLTDIELERLARQIWLALDRDIRDRQHLGDVWDGIDPEVKDELRGVWIGFIKEAVTETLIRKEVRDGSQRSAL